MNQEGLTSDFFTLFALPPVFRISLTALEEHYLALQRETHPDRFANAPDTTRRLSMQLSARINEGYQTLKQPLSRALYLLERVDSGARNALPAEFLMEQMEWREGIAEAKRGGNAHELEHISERLMRDLAGHYETLATLLDDKQDYPAAADLTQRLMFLEKLCAEAREGLADMSCGQQF